MSKSRKPNAQERIEKAVAKHWRRRGAYAKATADSTKSALRATKDCVMEYAPVVGGAVALIIADDYVEATEAIAEAENIENSISYAEYIAKGGS